MSFPFELFINGVLSGAVYALVAVGLTMIWGVLRAINFAHGEYYMLGATFAWAAITYLDVAYSVAIPITLACAVVVALVVSRTVMERLVESPVWMAAVATLGLSLVLQNGALLIFGGDVKQFEGGWTDLTTILGVPTTRQREVVLIVTLVVFVALEYMVRRMRIGKAMRAVSQNQEACRVLGIDVAHVARTTTVLGISLAALAGVLVAPTAGNVTPVMGAAITLKAFIVIVVGGIGNVGGTLLAAMALGIVESFVTGYLSLELRDAAGYIALVLILMLRPQGLFSLRGRYS